MWTVVYVAPNRPVAEMLSGILTNEGIAVNLRSASLPHLGAAGSVQIAVPASEAEEALEVINAFFSSYWENKAILVR